MCVKGETKIGKKLEKSRVSEEELIKKIEGLLRCGKSCRSQKRKYLYEEEAIITKLHASFGNSHKGGCGKHNSTESEKKRWVCDGWIALGSGSGSASVGADTWKAHLAMHFLLIDALSTAYTAPITKRLLLSFFFLGLTGRWSGTVSAIVSEGSAVGASFSATEVFKLTKWSPSAGKSLEATSFSKGTESAIMTGDKGILSEERKHLLAVKKVELEKQIQERAGAQASSTTSFQQQDSSSTKGDVDSVWRPSVLGTNITLGDKRIGIKTSVMEEKATACNMLCCYADELKEGFFPWIDQVAGTLVPLLKFYFHEEVRKAAVSAMPELLRSAKLAIEKGQSQGRDASYLKFLSDSIIPVLVDALHKELN
ncbi:Importin [Arachis hypogaea]|nr:Importin [Arachis hypogaea]